MGTILVINRNIPNFIHLYIPFMTQGRYMLDTFSKVDFNEILVLMLMCRFWNLVVKFIHTLLVLERLAIHSLNLLGNCFKHSSSYLAACFFGCLNYKQVWCMWLSFKRVFHSFFLMRCYAHGSEKHLGTRIKGIGVTAAHLKLLFLFESQLGPYFIFHTEIFLYM